MNAPKRRGTAFETAVVTFLRGHGFPDAERRVCNGTKDRGDVAGVKGWTLECKAERALDVAGALTEAKAEAVHAGTDRYAAVIKRRSHAIADAYVVIPLKTFAELVATP